MTVKRMSQLKIQELECVSEEFHGYCMNILLGDSSAKVR
jgi:hypothetical protein